MARQASKKRLFAGLDWASKTHMVCVVDADGRLDKRAPHAVARRFSDERVGGVQVLVRIYNRSRVLTWFQDVEFSIYGLLYQAGRTPYGAAGMGGNGQFNRLSAIDSVVDEETGGPWRDKLTEDQDLGLRLLAGGWRGGSQSGGLQPRPDEGVDRAGRLRVADSRYRRSRWGLPGPVIGRRGRVGRDGDGGEREVAESLHRSSETDGQAECSVSVARGGPTVNGRTPGSCTGCTATTPAADGLPCP